MTGNQQERNGINGRKGFFLYYDSIKMLESLPNEQFGKIVRALVTYSEKGVLPEFGDAVEDVTFNFLRLWDDIDKKNYNKIMEQRRAAGKKGAKARWEAVRNECV